MPTRIRALDALETFVPVGAEDDKSVRAAISRISRWFAVDGGHRVLIPYHGGAFDEARFHLVKGGWEEHCIRCKATIESMTQCWVTKAGLYIVLCEACYRRIPGPHGAEPA